MSGKFVKAQNSISMDQPELNLHKWAAEAKTRSDPAISRRFSGSYITSTASSPGYPFPGFSSPFLLFLSAHGFFSSLTHLGRAQIDPATYSFTNAIKALQARSLNSWECFSLHGFTLNSKWNEAEKYICNPLSGKVPLECLSAKSLSGRSFTNLIHTNLTHTNKKTMPFSIAQPAHKLPIPEKKVDANAMTREVGTQSISMIVGSNSPSPASTPPIVERALKRCESNEDSTDSNSEVTSRTEVIRREMEEERAKEEENEEQKETIAEEKWKKQGGCLSWMKKKNQKEEQRSRRKRFLSHLKLRGC